MTRLLSRWLFSLLGTILIAALLWLFAPLWPPLEPALPRIIAIQTLLVVWALANAALDWRRRRRDAALGAGLSEAAEESTAVGQTLARAIALLRKSGRRSVLTDLPWYAIIGPPGAGKTTALLNAGLAFTLKDQLGHAAIAGAGGTRLCEWWFTDQAVLIDTAGRYTTQDSDAEVDRAGWNAFLGLLKRTRPHQPLNGVIVAIGLPDLIQSTEPERAAHAAAIARRIAELETRFALRLPVYLLFTKADLVAGFSETFDGLDAQARAQVWGETFPLGTATPLADRIGAALRTLAATLARRMVATIAAEHRADRRPAIAGFPTQFASLERPLAAFAAAAFAGTPLLRGVYFASGTQEGTPMDRLTGAMSRVFGLPGTRPASLRPESGRAYFLQDLLQRVVFNEALLVRRPPTARRRRAALRIAGFATILLAFAAAAAALLWTANDAQEQLAGTTAALAAYDQAARPLAASPLPDDDLRPVDAILTRAEALAATVPTAPTSPGPGPLGFGSLGFGPLGFGPLGFGQTEKLQAGAHATYRDALAFALLPRLVARTEAAMRGALARPGLLYELTRIDLMLGGAGPLDPAQIHAFMARDWARAYPDDDALQTSLLAHLDHLMAEPLPPVALDGPLIAAARISFQQVPAAARVYANLQSAAAALPPWRPVDSLGPAGVVIFTRASGLPMTDGVPGLFTAPGYRSQLQPALAAAARQIASETWVTGRTTEFAPAELQALEQSVTALYTADFTRRWDAILADLDIAPIGSLPQAAQALYILASPESPLRALLRSASLALQLPPSPSTAPLLARYAPLIALTAGDGAPLERALRLVADIQQPLAKIAALPVGTAAPPGGDDIGDALKADAARQPQPLSRWLANIAATAQALRTGNARRQVTLAYNAPGGPAQACAAALPKYPFSPAGPQIAPDEFARLFAPAGALDAFLNTQLKPFIDTAAKPWHPQPNAPFRDVDAAQFQRAAAIRDAYFPPAATPATNPGFTVDLTPVLPARTATPAPPAAVLTVAGIPIPSAGSTATRPTQVTWPPLAVPSAASLVSPGIDLSETGPWALNRLLAHARLQPGPKPGHLTATFGAAPNAVAYDIATPTNPFAPGLFTDFRCPALQ